MAISFQLDVITTTGGLVTLQVDEESARDTVDASRRIWASSASWVSPDDDRLALRANLATAYKQMLAENEVVVGQDEHGATWVIRCAEVVGLRLVDPELEAPSVKPRQVASRPV